MKGHQMRVFKRYILFFRGPVAVSTAVRLAIIPGLLCVVAALTGCSGSATAPTEIKGMTPAEYREKAEQALGSPPDGSPKATSKPGRKSR
jgi:hypothetical protein